MPFIQSDGKTIFKIVLYGPTPGGQDKIFDWLVSKGSLSFEALNLLQDTDKFKPPQFENIVVGLKNVAFQLHSTPKGKKSLWQRRAILKNADGIIFVWTPEYWSESYHYFRELLANFGNKLISTSAYTPPDATLLIMVNNKDKSENIGIDDIRELLDAESLEHCIIYEVNTENGMNISSGFKHASYFVALNKVSDLDSPMLENPDNILIGGSFYGYREHESEMIEKIQKAIIKYLTNNKSVKSKAEIVNSIISSGNLRVSKALLEKEIEILKDQNLITYSRSKPRGWITISKLITNTSQNLAYHKEKSILGYVKHKERKIIIQRRFGIVSLDLAYSDIYDINDIKGLQNLTELNELYLEGNYIEEISGFENLISLNKLTLKDNPIYEWTKNKYNEEKIDKQKKVYFSNPQTIVKDCQKKLTDSEREWSKIAKGEIEYSEIIEKRFEESDKEILKSTDVEREDLESLIEKGRVNVIQRKYAEIEFHGVRIIELNGLHVSPHFFIDRHNVFNFKVLLVNRTEPMIDTIKVSLKHNPKKILKPIGDVIGEIKNLSTEEDDSVTFLYEPHIMESDEHGVIFLQIHYLDNDHEWKLHYDNHFDITADTLGIKIEEIRVSVKKQEDIILKDHALPIIVDFRYDKKNWLQKQIIAKLYCPLCGSKSNEFILKKQDTKFLSSLKIAFKLFGVMFTGISLVGNVFGLSEQLIKDFKELSAEDGPIPFLQELFKNKKEMMELKKDITTFKDKVIGFQKKNETIKDPEELKNRFIAMLLSEDALNLDEREEIRELIRGATFLEGKQKIMSFFKEDSSGYYVHKSGKCPEKISKIF